MNKKRTKGFVFKDIKDSRIERNSASGYDVGFDVTNAANIDFSYNTADVESRNLIDAFLRLKKELRESQIDFPNKEEVEEVVSEVIEQLNKEETKPNILKMLHQRLDAIVVGTTANIIGDKHAEIFKMLGDGVETLKSFIESM